MLRIVEMLARTFAVLGGLVLSALIMLTCLSILGRSLNSILHSDWAEGLAPALATALLGTGVGPINGDFEIVEAGMAFAIFAFLPLCQWHSAHASVDIFTRHLSTRVNRGLRAIIEVVFAAVLILIAVQLFKGALSKYNSGQTTLLIEFPVWWAYAASVVAACVAALTGVVVAGLRVVEAATGQTSGVLETGSDH